MTHIYKMSTWQSPSGVWYVNDVEDLASEASKWYIPMRIMELTVEEYIELLYAYDAVVVSYNAEREILNFYFEKSKDAHKFVTDINKKAKERGFLI